MLVFSPTSYCFFEAFPYSSKTPLRNIVGENTSNGEERYIVDENTTIANGEGFN